MNAEKFINQVCTPEQAVKLKELGVDDKAPLLAWKDISFSEDRSVFALTANDGSLRRLYYPAYTVAELGEMLPEWVYKPFRGDTKEYRLQTWRNTEDQYEDDETERKTGFMAAYILFCGSKTDRFPKIDSKEEILMPTEAQARAAMLIYLLENGIVSTSKTPEA